MKPEDIKDKKIAVLCDTLEKAKAFYEICNGREFIDINIASIKFKKYLCIALENEKLRCMHKDFFELNCYEIIEFEEFTIGETYEEPLSAEEVLEVLVNEYVTGKYIEIFGCNPCLGTLTSKFTPVEIVQKVTEWKRKQDNKTQVTEDMIADALDEKYGVGNWGRE